MDEVQVITDALAVQLGRAVYVEDAAFRPLAASAQVGHIDDARIAAVLARRPTAAHLQYFRDVGVHGAKTPRRIPASSAQGLSARVVIPVVTASRILARIWLIDHSPRVSDADIKLAVDSARQMTPLLDESIDARRDRAGAGAKMLRALVHAGQNRRVKIFQELGRLRGITDPHDVRACAIRTLPAEPAPESTGDEAGSETSGAELCVTVTELLDVHRAVGFEEDGALYLLLAPLETGSELAPAIQDTVVHAARLHGVEVHPLGLSARLRSIDDIGEAFRQAVFSARVASRVQRFCGGASWDHLGEYKLFSGLGWSRSGVAELHPGVAALVYDHPAAFAATLLLYLEREGDVESTARELHIHRTTLYYRLRRAREVIGESATGSSQFSIHAALKFGDLITV